MSTNRILIILGHPDPDSLCHALGHRYVQAAQQAGHDTRVLDLSQLSFDLILHHGYRKRTELEPCLLEAQELIRWSSHLVFVYPIWWGSMPALLKGFLDRVFLPGFGFKYRENSVWWDRLLSGRSARLIVTMDMPAWYFWLRHGKPGHRQMKTMTLEFCGIRPVRITSLGPIKGSTPEKRERYLGLVARLGTRAA